MHPNEDGKSHSSTFPLLKIAIAITISIDLRGSLAHLGMFAQDREADHLLPWSHGDRISEVDRIAYGRYSLHPWGPCT